MTALAVVENLDVLEERCPDFETRLELGSMNQFVLQRLRRRLSPRERFTGMRQRAAVDNLAKWRFSRAPAIRHAGFLVPKDQACCRGILRHNPRSEAWCDRCRIPL